MHCPFCQCPQTSVVDSRTPDPGTVIRRRRECPQCGKRFTTFERISYLMPWIVKRGGLRVEYDRRKLRASMELALRKRPISSERIDAAVDAIEQRLMLSGDREVRSKVIGDYVLEELRAMDIIGWIRFASVYLNIDDPKSFTLMIEEAIRQQQSETGEEGGGRRRGRSGSSR
ncbi:transcriptional regulator NrdR [Sutterella sp.]|uniref:transcriptional regulator NrdR n=1 Tax=Sutterella sp. TaxID=1981025 RepID=UPI0026DED09A|nr:transcriptional regulator NrdR [Sutterella sp.]MDO5531872.1 transcriptional regulator NrdR [Sutterella sp.]